MSRNLLLRSSSLLGDSLMRISSWRSEFFRTACARTSPRSTNRNTDSAVAIFGLSRTDLVNVLPLVVVADALPSNAGSVNSIFSAITPQLPYEPPP